MDKSAVNNEQDINALIRVQPAAHSLMQPFYLSHEIYQRDVANMLMEHWHCVGHVSMIATPGEWFTYELDRESVIIVRGHDNVVRGLANVCTHRGSRLCYERSGRAKSDVLVCPYHAWVFKLDGSLRNARMMPDDFDKDGHRLKKVPLHVIEGLIFVTFAEKPLDISAVEETITSSLGVHGWASAKVATQKSYTVYANWKLALENQMECYHCAPSHPDYTRLHSQARPGADDLTCAMENRAAAQGVRIPARDQWALQAKFGAEADYCRRYAMWEGILTGSEDGQPVAPLMGQLKEYDGGMTLVYAGPVSFFIAYNDYGAIFRYAPKSVGETEMHVTWLVRGDAVEGRDYDVDKLTWVWRITSEADKLIVEQNQLGVQSRYYRPGPYALPIESSTLRFIEWYLNDIRKAV